MNTKEDPALQLIKKALETAKNPVILFSGGKDSTCILDLVRKIRPETPAMFNNTGVEARSTVEYCHTIPNLIENHPASGMTFWKCVEQYGFPDLKGKKGHHDGNKCCVHLKERPGNKMIVERGFDLLFLGLTMHESFQRRRLFQRMGPHYFHKAMKVWKCYPIYDWTEDEVWAHIRTNKITYNKGYDEGWKRCGCMPCTAHLHWQDRLARENPKLLKIVLRRRYGQMQCGDFFTFGHDLDMVENNGE